MPFGFFSSKPVYSKILGPEPSYKMSPEELPKVWNGFCIILSSVLGKVFAYSNLSNEEAESINVDVSKYSKLWAIVSKLNQNSIKSSVAGRKLIDIVDDEISELYSKYPLFPDIRKLKVDERGFSAKTLNRYKFFENLGICLRIYDKNNHYKCVFTSPSRDDLVMVNLVSFRLTDLAFRDEFMDGKEEDVYGYTYSKEMIRDILNGVGCTFDDIDCPVSHLGLITNISAYFDGWFPCSFCKKYFLNFLLSFFFKKIIFCKVLGS